MVTQRGLLIVQQEQLLKLAVSDYIDRIVDGRGLRQRVITQPRPNPDILGIVLDRIGIVNGTDFRVMNDLGRVERGGASQQRRDQTSQLNFLRGVHG
jgi:hypothetical protein